MLFYRANNRIEDDLNVVNIIKQLKIAKFMF